MRIVTGSARGITLQTLEGEATRPTPSAVKEAIFSSIQFDLEGRTMLDLFAGSGQMGLEALSRGAEKATLVDGSKDAHAIIMANAKKTKLYPKTNVLCMDWEQYIKSAGGRNAFDIIFLDPPYAETWLEQALETIADIDIVSGNGIIVCESALDKELPELSAPYEKGREYRYGKIKITLYHRRV